MRTRNGVHTAEQGAVFVGPSRIVNDAVDGSLDLALRRRAVGLRGHDGTDQFLRARLDHFGEPVEDLPAIVGAAGGPGGKSLRRGLDRVAEILARAERDVCKEFTG